MLLTNFDQGIREFHTIPYSPFVVLLTYTVEWADLGVGLTHRVNDSQVVHPSGRAFYEMGYKRHRVRAAWALGVGPGAGLRNGSSR